MSKENITAYKGFNKDLTCNGFQYEIGKEYEMPEDEVQICRAGFHACESPLEVLDHYFMDDNCDMARFAEVEQSGKISMENDGSTKMASSKIRIKAELKFSDLVKIGIDWLIEKTKPVAGKKGRNNDGGENSAKIGSSGDSAKIGSSGDSAQDRLIRRLCQDRLIRRLCQDQFHRRGLGNLLCGPRLQGQG